MTLKTIKNVIRGYYIASCKRKKIYNIINVIFRWFQLKYNKVDVHIYKCAFGNHYHVGRCNAKTLIRKRRYDKAISFDNILQGDLK